MQSIMIDMDEVIVNGNFSNFLTEFLGSVDFSKLESQNRQDLIKGKEKEFRAIYGSRNLYKDNNDDFIEPLADAVSVINKLSKKYEIYIVTSYIWKENVIEASLNLKNKFEYLQHFFPFINPNNFIFITDKKKIHFDIGIDDRISNLANCDKKLLFTEFRNKKISDEELTNKGVIRVNTWLEVEKTLL